MSKIYNEIVIDMNPESPTFEETLYEDSFEYNGDMMLMQGETIWQQTATGWTEYYEQDGRWVFKSASPFDPPENSIIVPQGTANMQGKKATGNLSFGVLSGEVKIDKELSGDTFTGETEQDAMEKYAEQKYGWQRGTSLLTVDKTWADIKQEIYSEGFTKYSIDDPGTEGLESLTSDKWSTMNLDEKAKYILDTKYSGDMPNEDNDLEIIKDYLKTQPIKGEIDPTKAGYFAEQYGGDGVSFSDSLAGRTAGTALKGDMYSLQDASPKVGGTPLTGVDMRNKLTGQQKIKKGFDTAHEAYGLSEDTADLDYRKSIYGLEEGSEAEWETDWTSFWNSLPDATGN